MGIGEVKSLMPRGVSRSKADKILVASNDRNGQVFDLYMVDTASGEKTLVKENPGYAAWVVDNDLEPAIRRPLSATLITAIIKGA